MNTRAAKEGDAGWAARNVGLAHATGESSYRDAARRTWLAFGEEFEKRADKNALEMADWALALHAAIAPETIAASSSDGSMLRKITTVIRNTTPTPRMASTKIMPPML